MKSFEVDNFLDINLFDEYYQFCLNYSKNFNESNYSCEFGRYAVALDIDIELKNKLAEYIRNFLNDDDLEITFIELAKYQIVGDCTPFLMEHLDRLPSTYTIDLTLETTLEDWGLNVNDKYFKNSRNHAIVLKGDEDVHYRPKYPSDSSSDYCLVSFIHVAPKSYWANRNPEIIKHFFHNTVPIYRNANN